MNRNYTLFECSHDYTGSGLMNHDTFYSKDFEQEYHRIKTSYSSELLSAGRVYYFVTPIR